MTEQPQEVQAAPPLALVRPSPIQASTGVGNGPEGNFVVVRYETVVGSIAILLKPEQAKAHGEELIRRAAMSASGIELPPGVRL